MTSTDQRSDDPEFWLRSIEDLDQQHMAGELPTDTYRRLRDDYTSQAASRIRHTSRATPRVAPAAVVRRRSAPVVIGVLAITAIAALAIVPTSIRNRSAGETITGNAQSATAAPTVAELRAVVTADPANPTAQLALARALLESNQLVEAMTTYERAEQLDPTNAEPAAYRAWVMLLAGLTDESVAEAERAVGIDGDYPDAHLILALALREAGDVAAASGQAQAFLDLTDDGHPMRVMADALLDQLGAGPVDTGGRND